MSDRCIRRLLACAVLVTLVATVLPAVPAAAERADLPSRQETDRVVVLVEDASRLTATLAEAGVPAANVRDRGHGLAQVEPPEGMSTKQLARRLAGVAGVRAAATEGRVRALGATVPPNDPLYPSQRTYLGPASEPTSHAVNLEPAWQRAFNGVSHAMNPHRAGVKIAIVDTGVSMPFSETTGEFVPVWDYINSDADPSDDQGHGTTVASVLRAKTDNGVGIAGVLHSSANQVLVYKVLDANASGVTADSCAAIMDAADKGAKVINCSIGEPVYVGGVLDAPLLAIWTAAVDYATAKGAVVVAAAGNTADEVYAPAAVPNALAVGAMSPYSGERASFSCTGTQLDVSAPGVDVYLVTALGGYAVSSGTSYSTPIVSGSLALLWSLVPDTPAAQMTSFVSSTASDYAPVGFDPYYGNGRIDVDAAYSKMVTDIAVQPPVTISSTPARGYITTLTWTPGLGTNVFYAYGCVGGTEYVTSNTSARLFLDFGGSNTVYVKAFAGDRWSSPTPATTTIVAQSAAAPPGSTRLAGANRYETAARVSRAAFPSSAPAVVLASGTNWPDALGAATLARVVNGPLLLTDPASLSLPARDEIQRLRPSRIFVIGGTAAVSAATLASADSLLDADTVTRISGADRFATAGLVANAVKSETGSIPGATAYIASGQNYPDALAGAALAASSGRPILLVRSNEVPAATRSALTRLGIRDTVVLGGTKVIPASLYSALPSPERVAGANRYATARAIADHGVARGSLAYSHLGLAVGANFPDALAAGPYLGALRGPLLLVPPYLDPPLQTWLEAKDASVADQTVFGGTGVVPQTLADDIRNVLVP